MRRFVLAISLLAAAAGPAAAQEARELRVYDVSLFVSPVEDRPGPGLDRTGGGAVEFGEGAGDVVPLAADDLVNLIRGSIEPDSWGHAAARCEVAGTVLEIVNTPAVHEQVAALLATFRATLGQQVSVRVRVVRGDLMLGRALLARSADGSGVLPAGGAEAALAALPPEALVAECVVIARVGQRAHAAQLRDRAYMRDYDTEVAQEASAPDPVVDVLRLGCVADVRPMLGRVADRVTIECRLAWADLPRPPESLEWAGGRIQLPEPTIVQAAGLARLAFGETWVAGATSGNEPGVYFLVTPERRSSPDVAASAPPKAPPVGQRTTRVYGIAELCYHAPDFPGPWLRVPQRPASGAAGMAFGAAEAETGVRLTADLVIELIKRNLEPDSWEHPRNVLAFTGTTLIVTHLPAMHEQIAKFLDELGRTRAPVIRIEAALLVADAGATAALAGADRVPLPGEVGEALVTAAGAANRLRAHGTVSAQSGERVFAAWHRDVPMISDFEVELAQKAVMADPIVTVLSEGVVLDAQPTISGAGTAVLLELRASWSAIRRPVATVVTPHGPITLPEADSGGARASLVAPLGAWTAFRGVGVDAQGRPLVLLVRATRG